MTTTSTPMESLLLEVFREQRGRIWGFVMRGTGSEEVAEDLLQESFLRVWNRRGSLERDLQPDDREGMRRYLWRVLRNLMVDEIRSRQRRRKFIREPQASDAAGTADATDSADLAPGAEETLAWQQCLDLVRDTVGRVKNPQHRRCLQLWLEGLDPQGIGEQLGLGPGQVRGMIQRARSEVVLRASNLLRTPGEPVR